MRRLLIYASIIILALLVGCSDEECQQRPLYKLTVDNSTDTVVTVDICGSSDEVGPGKATEDTYGDNMIDQKCTIHAYPNEKYVQYMRLHREEFRRVWDGPNANAYDFFLWENKMRTEVSGTSCTVTRRPSGTRGTVIRDSKGQLALRCSE